ncbi:MAG: PEGA domain-containing protein [Bacteroidaceae bacterium]|nr:PEGA domain-containing protein [Bacteroidaceae bacterium]
MNIQKYILTLLFMLLATVQMAAQGLVVKQFYHAERDFTANSGSTIVLDANEQPCALIKVRTNEHGFTFDSGRLLPIEKTEEQTQSHPLEIYVWVQSGAKRLSIGHKQLGNLYDYDLGQHLRSSALEAGQTYILELVSGEVQTIVKQARTSQYVVFQLTPPDAVVKLDGQMLKTIDGTAQKLMPFGTYQYTVEAPDYKLEVGRIQVNDPDSAHTVRVQLKPDIAQITISVPDGAEIWVNGEKKGIGSWAGNLGAGMYILEAKKAGHRDTQRSVTIDPDAGAQTITLDAPRPIYGEADITSEPAMADIYIDGQQVGKTPRIVPKLTVGIHSVKLVRSGYADYTGTLTIKEGETASLAANMKKGAGSAGAAVAATTAAKQPKQKEKQPKAEKPKTEKSADTTPSKPLMKPTEFYVSIGAQPISLLGLTADVGVYLKNINIEGFYTLGLASETVYWGSANSTAKYEYKYKPMVFGLRLGYGILLANSRLRITPQVGIAAVTVTGKENGGNNGSSHANSMSGTIGARVDFALARHIGVYLTPEYGIALSKSSVYKELQADYNKFGKWNSGFNVRLGLRVSF